MVVGAVLLDDEDELDEIEIDPVAGAPWIPSWAQPATIAVKVTTTAIHFILIGSSLPELSAGGGWRIDTETLAVDGVPPELFEGFGVSVLGVVILVLGHLGPLGPRLHGLDVRVDYCND